MFTDNSEIIEKRQFCCEIEESPNWIVSIHFNMYGQGESTFAKAMVDYSSTYWPSVFVIDKKDNIMRRLVFSRAWICDVTNRKDLMFTCITDMTVKGYSTLKDFLLYSKWKIKLFGTETKISNIEIQEI